MLYFIQSLFLAWRWLTSWFPLFFSSESSIAFVKFKDVFVLRIFREASNLFCIDNCDLVHRRGAQSKGWWCVWKASKSSTSLCFRRSKRLPISNSRRLEVSGITLFWLVSECIGKLSFSVFPSMMLLSVLLVTWDVEIKGLLECRILLIKIIKWKTVDKALLNTLPESKKAQPSWCFPS